jgi:hypothetical protein
MPLVELGDYLVELPPPFTAPIYVILGCSKSVIGDEDLVAIVGIGAKKIGSSVETVGELWLG